MPRTALRLPFALLLMLASLMALAGCAAPASSEGVAAGPPPASKTMSTPYPAREAKPAVTVDYACKTHADCAVKDVGNCCGAMPACVNKNSPTDPQGVRAQCAASGMAGICGFADVSACQCVSGRCEADTSSTQVPVQ